MKNNFFELFLRALTVHGGIEQFKSLSSFRLRDLVGGSLEQDKWDTRVQLKKSSMLTINNPWGTELEQNYTKDSFPKVWDCLSFLGCQWMAQRHPSHHCTIRCGTCRCLRVVASFGRMNRFGRLCTFRWLCRSLINIKFTHGPYHFPASSPWYSLICRLKYS